jgi:hypothetical protein
MTDMGLTRILIPVPSASVIGALLENDNVGVAALNETDGGHDTTNTTANDESTNFGRYGIAAGKRAGSKSVVIEEAELILELMVLINAIVAYAFLFLDVILCTESDELLDGEASEDGLCHGIGRVGAAHPPGFYPGFYKQSAERRFGDWLENEEMYAGTP